MTQRYTEKTKAHKEKKRINFTEYLLLFTPHFSLFTFLLFTFLLFTATETADFKEKSMILL